MKALTRRHVLAMGWGSLAVACTGWRRAQAAADAGRLHARPHAPTGAPLAAGEHRIGQGDGRDGLLYVPHNLPAAGTSLLVLLHGATGSARGVSSRVGAFKLADEYKCVVLAPDSRDTTWDVIVGAFGPDVAFLDAALEHTFARVRIDPARLAIGGFSDGASYALSLGLINGDLFTHVLAFSPGFLVADSTRGRPAIYVSHGTHDEILPINSTSRRLVPSLKAQGYAVQYHEFDGPHTVPADVAREAFDWMTSAGAASRTR